jgi:hypothetical protein
MKWRYCTFLFPKLICMMEERVALGGFDLCSGLYFARKRVFEQGLGCPRMNFLHIHWERDLNSFKVG